MSEIILIVYKKQFQGKNNSGKNATRLLFLKNRFIERWAGS